MGFRGAVFSPDGLRITYLRHSISSAIWVSSTSGGPPVRLTHEAASVTEGPPTWSPDGNWLAYSRSEGGNDALVKFRLGSLDPPVVLKPKNQIVTPAWSPRGDWITFCCSPTGEWLLCLSRREK